MSNSKVSASDAYRKLSGSEISTINQYKERKRIKSLTRKKNTMTNLQSTYIVKRRLDFTTEQMWTQIEKGFVTWRHFELMYTIFSIAGLLIGVFSYEVSLLNGGYSGLIPLDGMKTQYGTGEYEKAIAIRLNSKWSNLCRCSMLVCSVCAIFFLTLTHYMKADWHNTHYVNLLVKEKLYKAAYPFISVSKEFMYEDPREDLTHHIRDQGLEFQSIFDGVYAYKVFIQLLFPYPFFDRIILTSELSICQLTYVPYFVSDFLLVIMFLRIYGLIVHQQQYHEYTDNFSKSVCQSKFGFTANKLFTIKIELVENPGKMTAYLAVISIFVFAFILRIFELPYEMNGAVDSTNLQSFFSSVWLTIITLTTVGYGDIFPITILGKITAVCTALWGTFIVSLMVLVVTQVFELKPHEQKAINYIKQCRSAAIAIQTAFRFKLVKDEFYLNKMKKDPQYVNKSSLLRQIREKWEERDEEPEEDSFDAQVLYFNKDSQQNRTVQADDSFDKAEFDLGTKMNKLHQEMYDELKSFRSDHADYKALLDETSVEIVHSNRVVKKEVIDMSDMLEKMSGIILSQDLKIKQQAAELNQQRRDVKVIRKILESKYGQVEDPKEEEEKPEPKEESDLPALFSLRKSPYYQAKINHRAYEDPIMHTNDEFKIILSETNAQYMEGQKEAFKKLYTLF